jgi:acyl-CoA thioester hydrolase
MFVDFDFQVVKQTTEWRASARFDDVLEISVATKHLGTTSFTLLKEFRIANEMPIIATVETVYVNVDPKEIKKAPLAENVRAALSRGAHGIQIDHAGFLQQSSAIKQ